MQEKYFNGDDVIDDATRPQNRPSIFPYKWKMNFYRNNWTSSLYLVYVPLDCEYAHIISYGLHHWWRHQSSK